MNEQFELDRLADDGCPHACLNRVQTGTSRRGLRWAQIGEWRVVAYPEGGYHLEEFVDGIGWVCRSMDEESPVEIEREMCLALGIECVA